jgi:hypothetical protein
VASLSVVEREQYRTLLAKMRAFAASPDQVVLNQKPSQAALLSTTRVGLAAAQRVFGQRDSVVLLQEEEQERWFAEIYRPDQEAFGWYALAWWSLREGLDGADEESIRRHYPIPEGSSYWVVVTGVQWGGLAGGANHELWRWDGARAEFLDLHQVITF